MNPFKKAREKIKMLMKMRSFRKEFDEFKRLAENRPKRFDILWKNKNIQLNDRTKTTSYDGHYVLHTAWAARILAKTRPAKHVDISSSLYFSAIVSAFIPIDFYDYRPAFMNLSDLNSKAGNLMALSFPDDSVNSISCMHTIEHIGLGRYGDPLDPDGDLKAVAELKRVAAPGGNLLFVSPIGRSKLMFNGHRIYSYGQIMQYFKGFELKEFSLIPDSVRKDGLISNASQALADKQNYGCGCFWFVKR